jgi:hypothetical protein
MARKSKEATPHLRVRIEPRLLSRLERAREKSGRTLTGEIVHRLEQTFRKEEDIDFGAKFGVATAEILLAAMAGTPMSREEIDKRIRASVTKEEEKDK